MPPEKTPIRVEKGVATITTKLGTVSLKRQASGSLGVTISSDSGRHTVIVEEGSLRDAMNQLGPKIKTKKI